MQQRDPARSDQRIDELRHDAVMAMRGFFMLALLPMCLLLIALRPLFATPDRVDWATLATPVVWLLLAASIGAMWFTRRCMTRLSCGCLTRMIQANVVLSAAALAAGAVMVWLGIHAQGTASSEVDAPMLAIAFGIGLLVISPVFYWFLVRPLRAAARLRAAQVGNPGVLFCSLPDTLDALSAKLGGTPPGTGRQRSLASIVYAALAAVIGTAGLLAVLWLWSQEHWLILLPVEFAALAGVLLLLRWSHRAAALGAAEIMKRDQRQPILYLRSFQDDSERLEAEWGLLANGSAKLPSYMPGAVNAARLRLRRSAAGGALNSSGRLEETLATELNRFGPFVAIGDPSERLPELGAARAYFDNDTWQSAIERWVDLAAMIIKVAGPTQWIRWELETILRHGALGKLIILMPPGDMGGRAARWRNVTDAFAATPWAPALGRIDPDELVALRFRDGGHLSTVSGGRHRYLDYAIALRIMLHEAYRERRQS